MLAGVEGLVDGYLTPDALWALTFETGQYATEKDYTTIWRARFAAVPFEDKGGPRYYQEKSH